jgi:hypothetical protein
MREAIIIKQEPGNCNHLINIYMPPCSGEYSNVTIRDGQGTVLQRLSLSEGNNVIDISHFSAAVICIKVETPYETILKEIKITA